MSTPFANFTDPTTSDGKALWKLATKPLKNEFSGAKSSYAIFKKDLRQRIKQCQWTDIITFTIDRKDMDLIDNADLIPLATVRNEMISRTAIISAGVGNAVTPGEPAVTQQEFDDATHRQFHSDMLHTVLSNSLSGAMEQHVAQLENQNLTSGDGPMLLKMIQTKARGKATKEQMRNVKRKLMHLKLAQHKWNVTAFSEEVRALVDTLNRNEVSFLEEDVTDMVVENFKLVTNREFKSLLDSITTEAKTNNTNVDWEDLLDFAEEVYQEERERGTWGKKSPKEERLIALQAQIQALQAEAQKAKQKPGSGSPPGSQPSGDGKPDKDPSQKKHHYGDWQFQNPNNEKTKKATVKDKNGVPKEKLYHWCKNHNHGKGMWVIHKPSDCKNKGKVWDTPPGSPSLRANMVVLDEETEE